MEIVKACVLGIVQGLTEFFPVSSSGHLVITPFILNWSYIPVFYTVLLHFATLLALVTVFYRDIISMIRYFFKGLFSRKARRENYFTLAVLIIIASVPAAITGFLLDDFIEGFFSNPAYVASFLLITAVFLFSGEYIGRKIEIKNYNAGMKRFNIFEKTVLGSEAENKQPYNKSGHLIAIAAGIGQAIAIFPGISRSGTTISFARCFGINREACVKFSFLMSIPVIFGAFIFEIPDILNALDSPEKLNYTPMIASFIFSYLSGLFAIKFLVRLSKNRNFNFFALYCILLSLTVFILIFLRKI
ncbi:MAG: undecaprenyl-diphosphate phosphatase [Actinobacteria bacterium]|nr:undecaprenyl-diphosphate phosphatase [Actinomycetota bacterium]